MPALANQTTPLVPAQYLTLGIYLVTSGIFSGLANFVALLAFFRFPRVLCTASAIPEIGLILSDICVAGLHPFSGSSALANRWLWGYTGCQLYGFFGFLFGDFQLLVIPFLAFDRYILTVPNSVLAKYRNKRTYVKLFILLALYALLTAIAPLVGWGSYEITPTLVSCTIDWFRDDAAYTTYITLLATTVMIVPTILAAYIYYKAYKKLSGNRPPKVNWAPKGFYGTVILGCLFSTPVAFSVYGICAVWPMVADPTLIPANLNAAPPPVAKVAGILNAFFYIRGNPQLWNCIKKMCGCDYKAELVQRDAEEELIWMETPREPIGKQSAKEESRPKLAEVEIE